MPIMSLAGQGDAFIMCLDFDPTNSAFICLLGQGLRMLPREEATNTTAGLGGGMDQPLKCIPSSDRICQGLGLLRALTQGQGLDTKDRVERRSRHYGVIHMTVLCDLHCLWWGEGLENQFIWPVMPYEHSPLHNISQVRFMAAKHS